MYVSSIMLLNVSAYYCLCVGEAASSHNPPSAAVLRLHHYRTKSREHAIWRFERDSTFRLNEFDNEDIYPSTPETQERWLEKWVHTHTRICTQTHFYTG